MVSASRIQTLLTCAKAQGLILPDGVTRCLLFRGHLSIELNRRTVGTFGIVHYIVGVRC